MSAPLPYTHLLRHPPAQARSAARVEALLDAAAGLLADHEPEEITIRDLTAAAGVPTGTLYQFFDDRDTVLQALAVRFLASMPAVLDGVPAAGPADWATTVDRVVDAYAAMIREHPAIRRLWLSGTLDAATRRIEQETDSTIAARLGALLQEQAGVARGTLDAATRRIERETDSTIATRLGDVLQQQAGSAHGTDDQWQALVALIDGLLRHAFREDPDGDSAALREGRVAARAYAAVVLGLVQAT